MRALHLSLLGICLLLFTASATTDLDLPGPYALDGETTHAALAIDLMRPAFPYSREYTLRIGNQPFPFGISTRAGALKAYMLWPLFAWFGPGIEVMRLLTIGLGGAILLYFYMFVREVFGVWTAFLALFFLSLDSSFIFYSKLDAVILEELLWLFISLYALSHFARTQKLRYLGAGLIAAILGIYSHITFIWLAISCFFSALLCFPEEIARTMEKKRARYLIGMGALGILIIFLYWFQGDTKTLVRGRSGWSEAFLIFERLSTMGGIVPDVLLGKETKILSLPNFHTRPLTDVFLIASLLFIILFRALRSRATRFLVFSTAILFLESSLTPQAFEVLIYHRMMPFYLLLVLLSAIAVKQALASLKNLKRENFYAKTAAFGLVLVAIFSVAGQVSFTREAIHKMRKTGGKGFWSDAIYSVAHFIEGRKWTKVIYFNPNHYSLVLLTRGEVPFGTFSREIFENKREAKRLHQSIQEASPRTLFVLGPMAVVNAEEFRETVQQLNRELKQERIFRDREGEPVYFAYTVHRK